MEARDFRSIGRAAQEALRRRAIVLIERQGMTQAAAARAVGVQRQTVNLWLKRYRAQGEAGVLDGRRISPRKGAGALTADQSRKVRVLMVVDDIYQIFVGILNPLFPIVLAIVLELIIDPWYLGIFWSLALFKFLDIPGALVKIFAPHKAADRVLRQMERSGS